MANPIKAIIILGEESKEEVPWGCGCLIVICAIIIFWSSIMKFCRGEDRVRLDEVVSEKEELKSEIKWDTEHNQNDPTWGNPKEYKEKIEKYNKLNQEEKQLKEKIELEDKKEKITAPDKIAQKNFENNPQVGSTDIDLSLFKFPATLRTTSDSTFLADNGKETTIPANTKILIQKRSASGLLTLEINGKIYVGNESRLSGKLKK